MLQQALWAWQSMIFNSIVASTAKCDQVIQFICRYVITSEQLIRFNVMHGNKTSALWRLFSAAYLASPFIACKRRVALFMPILTASYRFFEWLCFSTTAGATRLRTTQVVFASSTFECPAALRAYSCFCVPNCLKFTRAFWGAYSSRFVAVSHSECFTANNTYDIEVNLLAYSHALLRAVFSRAITSRIGDYFAASTACRGLHSVSLSLYHRLLSADGVIVRRFGYPLADLLIVPQEAT